MHNGQSSVGPPHIPGIHGQGQAMQVPHHEGHGMNGGSSISHVTDVTNEAAWMQLGSASETVMNYEQSIRAFDEVLRVNPNNTRALTQLGSLHRFKGDFDKAILYYRTVLKLCPDAGTVWGALGHCYLMLDDLENAYGAYQEALRVGNEQQDPNLWFGIGIMYQRYGSYDLAIRALSSCHMLSDCFEKASEVDFRLATLYTQVGQHVKALELFYHILKDPPPPLDEIDIWFQIGHVYDICREYESALSAFERVAQARPDHAPVLKRLGWLYLQPSPFENNEIASRHLLASIDLNSNDAQTWYILARCHMFRNHFRAAYDAFQQAIYRKPYDASFWCAIGFLYWQIKQHRDALDALTRAIRLNPRIPAVWCDVATLYETCGQVGDAIKSLQRAAELSPQDRRISERLIALQRAGPNGLSAPTESQLMSLPPLQVYPSDDTDRPHFVSQSSRSDGGGGSNSSVGGVSSTNPNQQSPHPTQHGSMNPPPPPPPPPPRHYPQQQQGAVQGHSGPQGMSVPGVSQFPGMMHHKTADPHQSQPMPSIPHYSPQQQQQQQQHYDVQQQRSAGAPGMGYPMSSQVRQSPSGQMNVGPVMNAGPQQGGGGYTGTMMVQQSPSMVPSHHQQYQQGPHSGGGRPAPPMNYQPSQQQPQHQQSAMHPVQPHSLAPGSFSHSQQPQGPPSRQQHGPAAQPSQQQHVRGTPQQSASGPYDTPATDSGVPLIALATKALSGAASSSPQTKLPEASVRGPSPVVNKMTTAPTATVPATSATTDANHAARAKTESSHPAKSPTSTPAASSAASKPGDGPDSTAGHKGSTGGDNNPVSRKRQRDADCDDDGETAASGSNAAKRAATDPTTATTTTAPTASHPSKPRAGSSELAGAESDASDEFQMDVRPARAPEGCAAQPE